MSDLEMSDLRLLRVLMSDYKFLILGFLDFGICANAAITKSRNH
jgi:hypothetical protein